MSARRTDLLERLAHHSLEPPKAFRINSQTEVTWDVFKDMETTVLEVLGNDEQPLRQRLYSGLRSLERFSARPRVLDPWNDGPPITILPALRSTLRTMLAQILGWNRPVLRSLTAGIPANLFECETRHPQLLSQILQNTWFSKTYSYKFDLTTAFNLLIVLYLVALTMEAAKNELPSELMWQELGALGVHGLLSTLLERDDSLDQFRALFGTPDFGAWLLVT